jgi:hypothetical protein
VIEPNAPEENSDTPTPPTLQARFRRLAPFALLAGAAVSVMSILPQLPRERHLDLRLDEPSSIVGVQLHWTAASAPVPSDEPLRGSTWRFAPGSAPRLLPATVRLPDGSYSVEIRIDRVDQTETVQRSITLGEADRITVPVR